MPVDEFMKIVYLIEFDKNNDDIEENEYADEEVMNLYLAARSQRTWFPIESWNLREYLESPDNYLDEEDYELFKKYKDYDPSGDEIVGVSQNFDIPVAVKYFTKYIDMNESKDLSRLKILAGI